MRSASPTVASTSATSSTSSAASGAPADIDSETLVRTRTVGLAGDIDDHSAQIAMAQMLFLVDHDTHQPLTLEIDSSGGAFPPGMALVALVRERRSLVHTTSSGRAAGVAAALFSCGDPGNRRLGKQARVAFTPVVDPSAATASADLARAEDALVEALFLCTDHPRDELRRDIRAGRSFDAAAAVAYGLADVVE